MRSTREWSKGFMFALGLCVVILAAVAAPVLSPHDLIGVTPNWDKALPSAQRFDILPAFNNEAVRDNETGLVWERRPPIRPDTWDQGRLGCAATFTGNRHGWRLPSLAELSS